ncbi:MAG: protein phosphatase CheZ [SAR324 cluster bacterium]|nr:protein phosphatase CheZ [SAR324 cluster bacterium]
MSHEPTIKVIVDKKQLLEDLSNLEGMMSEYNQLLTREEGEEDLESDALAMIRSHQQYLANAKVSLKVIDMVSAVMRGLLDRMEVDELSLKLNPKAGPARTALVEAGADVTGPGGVEILEQLVARVNSVAQNAPLAMQEKIRYLLLSSLNLFKGAVANDKEGIDDAINQINLLTSTRESQNLVKAIAIIARDVYNTLNYMSDEIPILDTLTESSDGISEAARKLKAVVGRLEEAAFANLDYLELLSGRLKEDAEVCERVQDGLRKSQQILGELKANHPGQADALTSLQNKLGDQIGSGILLMRNQIQENSGTYMSLTANQGFQDLTGQTLKKTIEFIEDLEMQLVQILKKYKPMFSPAAGLAAAPAEQTLEQGPDPQGITQNQDEVDDLLAALGF